MIYLSGEGGVWGGAIILDWKWEASFFLNNLFALALSFLLRCLNLGMTSVEKNFWQFLLKNNIEIENAQILSVFSSMNYHKVNIPLQLPPGLENSSL